MDPIPQFADSRPKLGENREHLSAASLIWAVRPTVSELLASRLGGERVITGQSFREAVRTPGTVAFVDEQTLPHVGDVGFVTPVVAVLESPLAVAVKYLARYPWLHHVVHAGSLDPEGAQYLGPLVRRLGAGKMVDLQAVVGAAITGRAARLN